MIFWERMDNLNFQIRWLLLSWFGSFAHSNFISFFFFTTTPLSFPFFCLCLCLLFPVLTGHYSSRHLPQTERLQQDKCWLSVLAHYLIAHPVLCHFLNPFLIQIQRPSCSVNGRYHLLRGFQLHLIMHVFCCSQCLYLLYIMLFFIVQVNFSSSLVCH